MCIKKVNSIKKNVKIVSKRIKEYKKEYTKVYNENKRI